MKMIRFKRIFDLSTGLRDSARLLLLGEFAQSAFEILALCIAVRYKMSESSVLSYPRPPVAFLDTMQHSKLILYSDVHRSDDCQMLSQHRASKVSELFSKKHCHKTGLVSLTAGSVVGHI